MSALPCRRLVVFATSVWICGCAAHPTPESRAQDLAANASIVVEGRVERVAASEEPLLVASEATVVIRVTKMHAGAEIVGDQTGSLATVILSKPESVSLGSLAMFFGNPRFAGGSLTMIDDGEMLLKGPEAVPPESLQVGLATRRDLPVSKRLEAASIVFRGTVASERPLEGGNRGGGPIDEHDPEWHVARVNVVTGLRGIQAGTPVDLLFAASRDIMWFNSPKLQSGQDAMFLAHLPGPEEGDLLRVPALATYLRTNRAYLVTKPFDVLPATEAARIGALIEKERK